MLSANLNLTVLSGVIGLLLLTRSTLNLPSIYDLVPFSLPHLVKLDQIIAFAFLGLLLNLLNCSQTVISHRYSNDNSKTQYVTISTPSR
uniref:Movement protein 2 n=1 Tax=Angelonia flower break virus TaxID=352882 RepID=A0A8F8N5L9_9TOMB|nr:movement protein 2 [Angelonia flower break virus]